jgi:hypothetical protein
MRSNTKSYGGKTHYTDSQNRDTTSFGGRELYHLQFWLQTASLETFGYNLVITQLVKKFTAFMEPEDSLPCSQDAATGP